MQRGYGRAVDGMSLRALFVTMANAVVEAAGKPVAFALAGSPRRIGGNALKARQFQRVRPAGAGLPGGTNRTADDWVST